MSLSTGKDLATIIGVAIALFTLVKSLLEYMSQGAQKRAEQFIVMRKRFKENVDFKEMLDLLERDDPKLAKIPFKEKRDLLGFFEEIALMTNTGLIRRPVAHYMFGYYAIKCWESENFWEGVNRRAIYWALFRDFVDQMREVENSFRYHRSTFRF